MRILLVSDHYPPFIGGVQRQTRALARELHGKGHVVCVATVWQDELPRHERPDHFDVYRLRQLRTLPGLTAARRRRHQPPFPDPVSAFALRRLIGRFKPDVVHCSGWFSYSAALALVGSRVPLVTSAREYGFSCANATMVERGSRCSGPELGKCMTCAGAYFGIPRGWIATLGIRIGGPILRRKTRAVHSVSRYVQEIVTRDFLGAEATNMTQAVIPSFRVSEPGDPDPAFAERLPEQPFILFVGALRRIKGLEALFAAYRRLVDPPPLVLLGTFERDTPPLPNGAIALGGVSYPDVLAAWDRCLFGVMPSLLPEPLGSSVHEGMSRGKAVIGTFPGGHADMIDDGESGLLVPPGDEHALRAAIERLLGDPAACALMGKRAASKARLFDAEHALPRFEDLYTQVLSGDATLPQPPSSASRQR